MNQDQAKKDFDALQFERLECLKWLEEDEVLRFILNDDASNNSGQNKNKNEGKQQQEEDQGSPLPSCGSRVWSLGNGDSNKEQQIQGQQKQDQVILWSPAPPMVQEALWGGVSSSVTTTWILRPLHSQEIYTLETVQQCSCRDWSRVYLYLPQDKEIATTTCNLLQQRVSRTHFVGCVILKWPSTTYSQDDNDSEHHRHGDWILPPHPGVHSNVVFGGNGCLVSLDAYIYNNSGIVDRIVIGDRAVVSNVCQFGNGRSGNSLASVWNPHQCTITVGPESNGGRDIVLKPESTLTDVCSQLLPSPNKTTNPISSSEIKSNLTSTHWSVVSADCLIGNVANIHSVYLHREAKIQNADCIQRCVLFPGACILHGGCTVKDTFLQWNAIIENHSYVSNVLAMECVHMGPHSKICDSILGPDVALGSGEVQSCLLGPNLGAHHQSLLISVIWPAGRGNVGYGANVGSNHTGRAPDQEAWAGEGLFWGLSSVIVYPINMIRSPYSVVAAGTKLSSQVLGMPFSLILNDDSAGSETSVVPGWVLSSSAYTLARSLQKWSTRRKAQRHYHYTGWPMMNRGDVLQHVFEARAALKSLGEHQKDWYTGLDSKLLGKCRVSEASRIKGIQAYTNFLRRCALEGLLEWMEATFSDLAAQTGDMEQLQSSLSSSLSSRLLQELQEQATRTFDKRADSLTPVMPWMVTAEETWMYQKFLLLQEFEPDLMEETITTFLKSSLCYRLMELEHGHVAAVAKSKHRDDTRGALIIPGYNDCHVQASQDKVVLQVQQEAINTQKRVQAVLKLME